MGTQKPMTSNDHEQTKRVSVQASDETWQYFAGLVGQSEDRARGVYGDALEFARENEEMFEKYRE